MLAEVERNHGGELDKKGAINVFCIQRSRSHHFTRRHKSFHSMPPLQCRALPHRGREQSETSWGRNGELVASFVMCTSTKVGMYIHKYCL